MSRKFSVVTTFNAAGYKKYGKRMIETFLKTWPAEVELLVYAEDCIVIEAAPNLHVLDLHCDSPELVAFKTKWRSIPKANGDVSSDPVRRNRKDASKEFKWNAIRFAHKVYAIFAAANVATDWLLWMDADTVCHSSITIAQLNKLCPATADICFSLITSLTLSFRKSSKRDFSSRACRNSSKVFSLHSLRISETVSSIFGLCSRCRMLLIGIKSRKVLE